MENKPMGDEPMEQTIDGLTGDILNRLGGQAGPGHTPGYVVPFEWPAAYLGTRDQAALEEWAAGLCGRHGLAVSFDAHNMTFTMAATK